ncbi:MAG: hypothetical protein A2Z83_01135 [Omnitrophica bacterium GWA2_52_8]|nr:MAG: hypothetical protein A2Z83_01135 [Omnitrophica bacterium GWA2_52_8]
MYADSPFPESRAFLAVFLSWFVAQLVKVARSLILKKRFSVRWLFDTGGMPSAHSATVASLATVTGLYFGFHSIFFLIVLIFTIITMFDAAGVRRSVGRQAQILNRIIHDLAMRGQVAEERLKELLGHTPVEVFAGALVGILMAYFFCVIL